MIMCPYCLTMQEPQQTNLCNNPHCGHKLAPKYVENARAGNIICLGTFGLPSHGKTALVSSLMQSAQNIHKIVSGSFVRALDNDTQNQLNEWSARYKSGQVKPAVTPPDERPRPLLVMNNKFATSRPITLVLYDLAGEALVRAGSQPEYVRALNKVNTIWCVVSLDDMANKNDAGYALDGLFSTYLDAMSDLHISIKGKSILVVYTKADVLLGMQAGLAPLPPAVEAYLRNDPYDQLRDTPGAQLRQWPFDEDTYFAEMLKISDILQEYTTDFVDGGGAFVSMVQDTGAEVYFTINSAFGSPLEENNHILPMAVRAMRVLDALIWAIRLDGPKTSEQEVALIVPASIEDTGLGSQETIVRFYEELSAHGGYVATYYPGQIEPAFPLGNSPTTVQPSNNLELIGPILDHLKPDTAVVLLVKDALPMDFVDLFASRWIDRLLLVVTRRELVATGLPHCRVFTHDGEIAPMVSAFLAHVATARTKKP